jgi:hypothetical protein
MHLEEERLSATVIEQIYAAPDASFSQHLACNNSVPSSHWYNQIEK